VEYCSVLSYYFFDGFLILVGIFNGYVYPPGLVDLNAEVLLLKFLMDGIVNPGDIGRISID